jgi:PAS domain S-box-containing protein
VASDDNTTAPLRDLTGAILRHAPETGGDRRAIAMLFSLDGARILWASPAALRFLAVASAESLAGMRFGPATAEAQRVVRLAAGMRAGDPPRLERIPFSVGLRSEPLTCVGRRIALEDGEEAILLTARDARRPALLRPAPPQTPADADAAPSSADEPVSAPAHAAETGAIEERRHEEAFFQDLAARDATGDPADPWRAPDRAQMRVVFETDPEGRVTAVSRDLARAVGPRSAAIVGRPVEDAALLEALRRGQPFRGVGVRWTMDDGRSVPVECSGAPRMVAGVVQGMVGFGLVRLAEAHAPAAPEGALVTAPLSVPETVERLAVAFESAEAAVDAGPTEDAAPFFGVAPCIGETLEPIAPPMFLRPAEPPVVLVSDEEPHEALEAASAAVVPAPVEARPDDNRPESRSVEDDAAEDHARPDAPGAETLGAAALAATAEDPDAPRLSSSERVAFREIARALAAETPAREASDDGAAPVSPGLATQNIGTPDLYAKDPGPRDLIATDPAAPEPVAPETPPPAEAPTFPDAALVDRLPVGVLVLQGDAVVFVNRTLLDHLGYEDQEAFAADGAAARMFDGRAPVETEAEPFSLVTLTRRDGSRFAVDAHLQLYPWVGGTATLICFRRTREPASMNPAEPRAAAHAGASPGASPGASSGANGGVGRRADLVALPGGKQVAALEANLRARDAEIAEYRAMLDTATDGVISLAHDGTVLAVNRSVEALFGFDASEIVGQPLIRLFGSESHATVQDYLDGLTAHGAKSVLAEGREAFGREKNGGRIPLFVTIGRVNAGDKFCAVLRDLTDQKRVESQLTEARKAAERSSAHKSEFLAKVSHEIRTPMNSIIGFSELMMEQRLGPIGNERYMGYLNDIHQSGQHVVSLVNDLLDLSKIEAGKADLSFAGVNLNDLVASCVSMMQPQAQRERVILRSQLLPDLPKVVADERSVRQIVLNLLSNGAKFNSPGGQVIVSTAISPGREAVIRVRDTGIGMTAEELAVAMQPFRQVATTRRGNGTGLGLPLTKALAEANRAQLKIESTPGQGTFVEVIFPSTRVLAE